MEHKGGKRKKNDTGTSVGHKMHLFGSLLWHMDQGQLNAMSSMSSSAGINSQKSHNVVFNSIKKSNG